MSAQAVYGLGLAPGGIEWVSGAIRFLVEKKQSGEIRRVAVYSEGGLAAPLVSEIQAAGLLDFVSGYYDDSHQEFDALRLHPQNLVLDNADTVILCMPQERYRHATRYLVSATCKIANIVLLFSNNAFAVEIDLKNIGLENKRPFGFHLFPCAGANRIWEPIDNIMSRYERRPRYDAHITRNSRYIEYVEKLGGDFAAHVQADIDEQTVAFVRSFGHYEYAILHDPFSLARLRPMTDMQFVVLLRDPRDIVNSYFHRSYGSPRFAATDPAPGTPEAVRLKDERLFGMLRGGMFPLMPNYFLAWPSIKKMASDFCSLLDCRHVHYIRFEDLVAKPVEAYRSMLRWLELDRDVFRGDLSEAELKEVMHLGSFEHQTGGARKEGEEHSFIHMKDGRQTSCRKGTAGDWKNHFSPAVKDYVKEQIGHELVQLGYEKDLNW